MSDESTSIVEFIEARLSEREAAARGAWPDRWTTDGNSVRSSETGLQYGYEDLTLPVAHLRMTVGKYEVEASNAAHIAANDPAYVLADIAAKRAILAEHALVESDDWKAQKKGEWKYGPPPMQYGCRRCDDEDSYVYGTNGCLTVRLLAAPFASHEAFNSDWSLT